MTFTEEDHLLALIIRQSYRKKKDRKPKFKGYTYIDKESKGIYAHYENDTTILLGIHGADDVKFNLFGLKSFLKIGNTDDIKNRVCKKLDKLQMSGKKVIVGGHSIGGFIINHCLGKKDYPFKFISYGSYTPRVNKNWSLNKVRKHIYDTDWLASKLISRPHNVNVYHSSKLNTHALFNFLDKKQMNKNSIGSPQPRIGRTSSKL